MATEEDKATDFFLPILDPGPNYNTVRNSFRAHDDGIATHWVDQYDLAAALQERRSSTRCIATIHCSGVKVDWHRTQSKKRIVPLEKEGGVIWRERKSVRAA